MFRYNFITESNKHIFLMYDKCGIYFIQLHYEYLDQDQDASEKYLISTNIIDKLKDKPEIYNDNIYEMIEHIDNDLNKWNKDINIDQKIVDKIIKKLYDYFQIKKID